MDADMVMIRDLNAIVRPMRTVSSVTLLIVACVAAASLRAQQDKGVLDGIESKRAHYADVAHQIWGFAEVGYQERKSSALLQSELKAAGFDVTAGVAGIPTASSPRSDPASRSSASSASSTRCRVFRRKR
jgi:hypothetical protein